MQYSPHQQVLFFCVVALCASGSLPSSAEQNAAEQNSAGQTVDYLSEVKPLLAAKCYSCHGVLKQEADLRLETRALMEAGGVLSVDDPAASMLIERVAAVGGDRMPPPEEGTGLKPQEIDLLRRWIEQGAVTPPEAIPEAPQQHWAFQRIERPRLPELETKHENPIDAFLRAQHQMHSLQVQPPAARPLRIRRLYLDLVGLPPTAAQLQDTRPWEEIVAERLADPQHGARWARHWMDVWRYSDWYGLGAQLRNSQKHMWHWRDWIVDSLNADKGYDRMIEEMLAGDELAPDDPEVVVATGFLARNYYLFNRTTWLDSTIEHTSKAFLGLTINCAKCHDHKYDPITHVDYYRFRAIFEPHQVRLDPVPGVLDFEQDGLPRVFDDHLDAKTHLHLRGDPAQPDLKTEIEPRVPQLLADFQPAIESVSLPVTAYAPGLREYVKQDRLQQAEAAAEAAHQAWQKAEAFWAEESSAEKLSAEESSAEESSAEESSAEESSAEAEPAPKFALRDEFDQANPEIWEIVGDGWQYQDGQLRQTVSSRDTHYLRLAPERSLPRDFDLRVRYTTTGGDTYKSVTFRFDEDEDRQYGQFVYSSAHLPGPKVQVAFTRNGKHQYPAEGQVARAIEVGQPIELRVAVRDRLVNVWLDGEFLLAYRLPDRRPTGRFSLSAFDATAAFDWIAIESLSDEVELTAAGKNSTAASDPRTVARLAKLKWLAAKAELQSLNSTLAADAAKVNCGDEEVAKRTALQAASDQAKSLRCQAEYDQLAAGTDDKKLQQAAAKLKRANEQLERVQQGTATYTSLRASRKALETPAHTDANYAAIYPSTSSGRRLALARWMTSRDNPLTARVAVNHVWMRHFGEPLVDSVFDFGLRAKRPEHLALLDYLACEFIESGWSFRHLHYLICTSQAYQRDSSTSRADAATLAADPSNQFYWRANTRRMEAQVVRDAVLHLAGTLDLSLGGPPVDVNGDSRRRSLYFRHSRDDRNPFLSMFDDADLLQCYRRSESVVPQQALAMANSNLSLTTAAEIAKRLAANSDDESLDPMVDAAFTTILGRLPDAAERDACLQYCQQMSEFLTRTSGAEGTPQATAQRVRARLVHVLLNHNDFVSIR